VKPYVYGCLTSKRWNDLLAFAERTNFKIILGLNGCTGRMSADGAMDLSNIRALLLATAASPFRGSLFGFEFSNEVFVNSISPRAWGADFVKIKAFVGQILGEGGYTFAGPDDASPEHLSLALNSTPPGTLNALTYHHYPGCSANSTDYFALDPACLAVIDSWGTLFSAVGAPHGVPTWAGETAEHGGGGVPGLTDSFTSSLYYAWQLGTLPLHGVELSARQALVGGDYELLSRSTLEPNPDFFVLWMFKTLVGGSALAYPVNMSTSVANSGVRLFVFSASPASNALRVLLALSLNTVAAEIEVRLEGEGMGGPRVEYSLFGDLGVSGGGNVTCNGVPLKPSEGGRLLPSLETLGVHSDAGTPLLLKPSSIMFATLL